MSIVVCINNKIIPTSDDYKRELVEFGEKSLRNDKDKQALRNFMNGKEVKSKKRFRKVTQFVSMTLLALWYEAMNTATYASAQIATNDSIPKEVDDVLFKVQLICLGICVAIGTIMAMVAGFFKMLGLREEAKKRYQDAIAGMVMVLTAPVVLGVIASIVRGLLRLFPQYAV